MIGQMFRHNRDGRFEIINDTALLTHPVSQGCTAAQFAEPAYAYWCEKFAERPRFHRKQWEFCFILQALARNGAMAPGMRGLGFGVGNEPLAAIFAANGISILATDLAPERAQEEGWVETSQHAAGLDGLNNRGLCDPARFEEHVTFQFADMNDIDPDIRDFDFCWSACAFEHLGTIQKGLDFVENSLECLRPGGIAVHTTEFNCHSDYKTLDNSSTVLFRRSDFKKLGRRLASKGHRISLNFDLGDQPLDQHIDLPPYAVDNHLKLQIAKWVTTSFGLIIQKNPAG